MHPVSTQAFRVIVCGVVLMVLVGASFSPRFASGLVFADETAEIDSITPPIHADTAIDIDTTTSPTVVPSVSSTTTLDTDNSQELVLSDETLTETFPTLKEGFEEVSLTVDGTGESDDLLKTAKVVQSLDITGGDSGEGEYLLDSQVKVTTSYSKKNTVSLATGNKPIKQLITIDNPTEQEINLNLTVAHTINSKDNTFFWDGKEYTAITTPQSFKAYMGTATINPQDSALDEQMKEVNPQEREHLPQITNVPTLKGAAVSFETEDNSHASYDFSDITNLDYDITVQRIDNQTILTLKLNNLTVNPKDTLTLDPTYDLASGANYNVRWDGAVADDNFTYDPLITADLNGNGRLDLMVGVSYAGNNSRSNSGSLYLIYDSLIDDHPGVGQTVDLAVSSNYNIRYDGAATGDRLSSGSLITIDLDSNGSLDLVVGAKGTDNNSRSNSGSLYLIYDSLIDDHPGVGQTVDLAVSSNYNIRYDGAAADDYLSNEALTAADIDGNGSPDLVVGAYAAKNNFRDYSGSFYLIFDSLIDDHPGVGQTVDLAISNNYNIRYDGAATGDRLSVSALAAADIDGNGTLDIMVGANGTDNNSRSSSGSLYIIYDSLIDNHPGVGQTVDLAVSSNYNIRYDGAAANDQLTYAALTTADLDGNGKFDLLTGAWGASNNSRSGSGSLYIVYDSLLDDHPGVGQTVDLAVSGNYSLRYDGAAADDYFSYGALITADIDGNGRQDLIIGAAYADNNSRSGSGSLYIVYDSLLDDHPGVGQTVDLAVSGNYSLRYDGAAAGDNVMNADDNQHQFVSDMNGDGKPDLLPWTPWPAQNSYAGSLYLLYNFPHTITLDAVTAPAVSSTTVTGSIDASNSITTISKVQASLDSSTFAGGEGGWSECTATDGVFDETSESFSCTFSSLSQAAHTVYVRAYDENVSYTAISDYESTSFSLAPASSTNTSSSDSTYHPPSCDTQMSKDEVPIIFIGSYDYNKGQVSIVFVPVKNVDGYILMYGTDTSSQYSARYDNSDSSGLLSYTINDLYKSDKWIVKAQAYKGCAYGNYSSDITLKRQGVRSNASNTSTVSTSFMTDTQDEITPSSDKEYQKDTDTPLPTKTTKPNEVSAESTTPVSTQDSTTDTKNIFQIVIEWVQGMFAK